MHTDVNVGDVSGSEWEVEWFDEDAEQAQKVGQGNSSSHLSVTGLQPETGNCEHVTPVHKS